MFAGITARQIAALAKPTPARARKVTRPVGWPTGLFKEGAAAALPPGDEGAGAGDNGAPREAAAGVSDPALGGKTAIALTRRETVAAAPFITSAV